MEETTAALQIVHSIVNVWKEEGEGSGISSESSVNYPDSGYILLYLNKKGKNEKAIIKSML